MPIVDTDIQLRLSVTSGVQGDITAQGDPNASLGRWLSTTQLSVSSLNNLFDNISTSEALSGDTEYRCFFILNEHDSLTFKSVRIWISSQTLGGATITLGVDPTAANAKTSGTQQAVLIGTENTAPAGVTFEAATELRPIVVGDLPSDYCRAIWVRRIVSANTPSQLSDGATIKISGESD